MYKHRIAAVFLAIVLCSCATFSQWKYIGIYKVNYRKSQIVRNQDTFRRIATSIAASVNARVEYIQDPYEQTVFLLPKAGDNRQWPTRIVMGEFQSEAFSISVIKRDAGEPDWLKKIREQIQEGFTNAGCTNWVFYLQHGAIFQ